MEDPCWAHLENWAGSAAPLRECWQACPEAPSILVRFIIKVCASQKIRIQEEVWTLLVDLLGDLPSFPGGFSPFSKLGGFLEAELVNGFQPQRLQVIQLFQAKLGFLPSLSVVSVLFKLCAAIEDPTQAELAFQKLLDICLCRPEIKPELLVAFADQCPGDLGRLSSHLVNYWFKDLVCLLNSQTKDGQAGQWGSPAIRSFLQKLKDHPVNPAFFPLFLDYFVIKAEGAGCKRQVSFLLFERLLGCLPRAVDQAPLWQVYQVHGLYQLRESYSDRQAPLLTQWVSDLLRDPQPHWKSLKLSLDFDLATLEPYFPQLFAAYASDPNEAGSQFLGGLFQKFAEVHDLSSPMKVFLQRLPTDPIEAFLETTLIGVLQQYLEAPFGLTDFLDFWPAFVGAPHFLGVQLPVLQGLPIHALSAPKLGPHVKATLAVLKPGPLLVQMTKLGRQLLAWGALEKPDFPVANLWASLDLQISDAFEELLFLGESPTIRWEECDPQWVFDHFELLDPFCSDEQLAQLVATRKWAQMVQEDFRVARFPRLKQRIWEHSLEVPHTCLPLLVGAHSSMFTQIGRPFRQKVMQTLVAFEHPGEFSRLVFWLSDGLSVKAFIQAVFEDPQWQLNGWPDFLAVCAQYYEKPKRLGLLVHLLESASAWDFPEILAVRILVGLNFEGSFQARLPSQDLVEARVVQAFGGQKVDPWPNPQECPQILASNRMMAYQMSAHFSPEDILPFCRLVPDLWLQESMGPRMIPLIHQELTHQWEPTLFLQYCQLVRKTKSWHPQLLESALFWLGQVEPEPLIASPLIDLGTTLFRTLMEDRRWRSIHWQPESQGPSMSLVTDSPRGRWFRRTWSVLVQRVLHLLGGNAKGNPVSEPSLTVCLRWAGLVFSGSSEHEALLSLKVPTLHSELGMLTQFFRVAFSVSAQRLSLLVPQLNKLMQSFLQTQTTSSWRQNSVKNNRRQSWEAQSWKTGNLKSQMALYLVGTYLKEWLAAQKTSGKRKFSEIEEDEATESLREGSLKSLRYGIYLCLQQVDKDGEAASLNQSFYARIDPKTREAFKNLVGEFESKYRTG